MEGTQVTRDRYRRSREMLERARGSLAGGVSSPFRAKFPVPLYLTGGCGPRVRDVDGNEYIDYTLAWGPLILGHAHPRIVAALERQARAAHIFGAQHETEIAVAEAIQRAVPCAERVAFTSSGSEAVQLALRLARAHTGRTLFLRFEGHYHGWMDSVLVSYRPAPDQSGPVLGTRGQAPNSVENVLVAGWNDRAAVERQFAARGAEIAAVICEPVLCNSGSLMPEPGFLEFLRRVTKEHGALLLFDEIITGFRMAPGGAQEAFSVRPDLATFGKAVAGGLPLSVVAGRRDILEQMADGGVAFGGTFNGNPMSMAAAEATLAEITREDGAALRHANRLGETLMAGIAAAARERAIPVRITGFGAAFSLHFTQRERLREYRHTLDDRADALARYLRRMLDEGVYLLPDGRMYVSAVHTEREAEETLEAVRRVFARFE